MKRVIVIYKLQMCPHKTACFLRTHVQCKYNRVVVLIIYSSNFLFLSNLWNQALIYDENIMIRKSRAAWHKIILNARHLQDVLFKIRKVLVIIGYVSTGGLFLIFDSWHQAFTSNLHMYKQDQNFWKTLNSSVSMSFTSSVIMLLYIAWYVFFPCFLLVIFHNHGRINVVTTWEMEQHHKIG